VGGGGGAGDPAGLECRLLMCTGSEAFNPRVPWPRADPALRRPRGHEYIEWIYISARKV